MKICEICKTRFVLSGQTLGLFNEFFDWYFAKRLFPKAELIGIRDQKKFSKDMLSLNIIKNKIHFVTDDATFCKYEKNEKEFEKILNKKKNILFNFHKRFSEHKYQKYIKHFSQFLNKIDKKKYDIYLIPMVPKDLVPLRELKNKLNFKIKILHFNFNYKMMKTLMSKSKLVITFKHHPIIFSASRSVNCMAIAPDNYYLKKNRSALKKLGLAGNIIKDSQVFEGNLYKKFEKIIKQKVNNSKKLYLLKKKQDQFYKKIYDLFKMKHFPAHE